MSIKFVKIKRKVQYTFTSDLYIEVPQDFSKRTLDLLLSRYVHKPLIKQYTVVFNKLLDMRLKEFDKVLVKAVKKGTSKTKIGKESKEVGSSS